MALPRHLTVADLYAMPESERGERYELIDGELWVNPAPVWRHQLVSAKLIHYLTAHVMGHELGWVGNAPGVVVDDRTYVIPDIVFIARERAAIIGSANVENALDLVCEILSAGTRRHDQLTKRAIYARMGVREYWLIDPEALSVAVLILDGWRYTELPAEPEFIKSRVFPELRLMLADLFRDLIDRPEWRTQE